MDLGNVFSATPFGGLINALTGSGKGGGNSDPSGGSAAIIAQQTKDEEARKKELLMQMQKDYAASNAAGAAQSTLLSQAMATLGSNTNPNYVGALTQQRMTNDFLGL